jgi:GTPase SAR1 family protein
MENEENIKKVLFKIIVIGDASVGKSCILNRFTKNEYRLDYNVTIGVEFSSKHITIDKT